MEKIQKALKELQKNYPKSLIDFYPGHEENGIPERNLTYQFVKAYLSSNKLAYGFFEVPFKNGRGVNHYDAIIIDKHFLIIIEAKRLYSKEKARDIGDDVDKIEKFYGKIRDKITNFRPSNKIYGLILAEAWSPMFDNGLGDWWKRSESRGTYKNWDKTKTGVCRNMKSWERDAIEIDYQYRIGKKKNKEKVPFHILYGYKLLK